MAAYRHQPQFWHLLPAAQPRQRWVPGPGSSAASGSRRCWSRCPRQGCSAQMTARETLQWTFYFLLFVQHCWAIWLIGNVMLTRVKYHTWFRKRKTDRVWQCPPHIVQYPSPRLWGVGWWGGGAWSCDIKLCSSLKGRISSRCEMQMKVTKSWAGLNFSCWGVCGDWWWPTIVGLWGVSVKMNGKCYDSVAVRFGEDPALYCDNELNVLWL